MTSCTGEGLGINLSWETAGSRALGWGLGVGLETQLLLLALPPTPFVSLDKLLVLQLVSLCVKGVGIPAFRKHF